MKRNDITFLWFAAGVMLMGFAVGCSVVTVAGDGSGYRPVLRSGLCAMAAALACLFIVLSRGGTLWRIAAVLASVPAALVIYAFVRRGS